MPRTPRKLSEVNLYHVFARGVGRQTIFEDSDDNERFCDLMQRFISEYDGSILAWCLMGNHFHLLVEMEMPLLSGFMKRLEVAYATYFNARYDRSGCLFQGRFGSEPIADDSQLLAAVRYIHLNPQKAGIARFDEYGWSSYGEYINGSELCNTDLVLGITGGISSFEKLHRAEAEERRFMEDSTNDGSAQIRRLSDGEVRAFLESQCGASWRTILPSTAKLERDDVLCQLKRNGASIRQISRITGIGRGIVQKAES